MRRSLQGHAHRQTSWCIASAHPASGTWPTVFHLQRRQRTLPSMLGARSRILSVAWFCVALCFNTLLLSYWT